MQNLEALLKGTNELLAIIHAAEQSEQAAQRTVQSAQCPSSSCGSALGGAVADTHAASAAPATASTAHAGVPAPTPVVATPDTLAGPQRAVAQQQRFTSAQGGAVRRSTEGSGEGSANSLMCMPECMDFTHDLSEDGSGTDGAVACGAAAPKASAWSQQQQQQAAGGHGHGGMLDDDDDDDEEEEDDDEDEDEGMHEWQAYEHSRAMLGRTAAALEMWHTMQRSASTPSTVVPLATATPAGLQG